jgi:hypothetical protein
MSSTIRRSEDATSLRCLIHRDPQGFAYSQVPRRILLYECARHQKQQSIKHDSLCLGLNAVTISRTIQHLSHILSRKSSPPSRSATVCSLTSTSDDLAVSAVWTLATEGRMDTKVVKCDMLPDKQVALSLNHLGIIVKEWKMDHIFEFIIQLLKFLQRTNRKALYDLNGPRALRKAKLEEYTCGHCGLEWKLQHRRFCRHTIVAKNLNAERG